MKTLILESNSTLQLATVRSSILGLSFKKRRWKTGLAISQFTEWQIKSKLFVFGATAPQWAIDSFTRFLDHTRRRTSR
jgi:hypothetical protein